MIVLVEFGVQQRLRGGFRLEIVRGNIGIARVESVARRAGDRTDDQLAVGDNGAGILEPAPTAVGVEGDQRAGGSRPAGRTPRQTRQSSSIRPDSPREATIKVPPETDVPPL